MFKMTTILIAAMLLISCERLQMETTSAFIPEISEPEFYFQGTVRDDGAQTPFTLLIGPADSGRENQRFFLGSTLSFGENGHTLLVGAYNANTSALLRILPRIEFQFWPGNIGTDDIWQAEEVREFFTVGNQYMLGGKGAAYFNFSLLMPLDGSPLDVETSKSRYLDNPSGLLTITGVEEYRFTDIGAEMVPRSGLLVRCAFEAEIGRYDLEADQADGNPNFFRTDEVVEFTEGEAVFFVAYD